MSLEVSCAGSQGVCGPAPLLWTVWSLCDSRMSLVWITGGKSDLLMLDPDRECALGAIYTHVTEMAIDLKKVACPFRIIGETLP